MLTQLTDVVLHEQREWLRVTLSSIGDAVMTTDTAGLITFLNPVAESLTGWTQADAAGEPLDIVFKIVNEKTRCTVENPAIEALREGIVVGLAHHTLLIAKDGTERPIDDSAAPIRTAEGEVAGVVLVFRDVSERRQQEHQVQDALSYADTIIATLREPFVVLDNNLRVKTANRSFYQNFHVTQEETQGRFIFDLGNGQWNIPRLRAMLDEVLTELHPVHDFDVEHDFPTIGKKNMLLNARRFESVKGQTELILLAIEDITERRHAERLVRESEQRFRRFLDKLPVGAYTCDAEGLITYFNPSAAEFWGREPKLNDPADHFCGSFKLFLIDGTPIRHDECWMALALREGKEYTRQEIVVERPDGSRRVALTHVTPFFDESGRLAGAVNVTLDITERKRTEDELRQSEQRQRFILDSMPQKIFTAKPNGDVDYFNPQWAEFTGLPFEQISGWGWKRLIHLDDVTENVRAWQHSIDSGEPFQFEHRFRRADGEYRWHVSRALPMRDEEGRVLMWVGSNTDVHDIKQAEMAMHDSEVRYRRLFEAAKDGILILDSRTGRIIDANPFMINLLGYSHDDFTGKELWEIGLFGDKSANEAAVGELQKQGYIRYEHLPLESNRGRRVEVEIVANAYREGNHSVIQCNIRDITERSRLERKTNEQAEALIDLHRRKDEFLAMLGHELRNPLAAISNAGHLLRLEKSEDKLQQRANAIIERQVGQLTRLVDDLLEVSRITTGRIHLIQERIDLNGVVANAVETVRPLIGQRRHSLKVSVPPQPIWLYADAARLEQVVVNLLTNAAKYTDEGGHIWLSVGQEGDEAVLRVRDSGVGIASELLPHIFDLFTQAERSLDRSQGGLGIGLCLVQRLVELHGGRVEARSTLGQGSEFVVRLPVVPNSATPPSPSTEKDKPTSTSLQVLVVDDNVDVAQSLTMLLEASGHDFRTAHDGPNALATALDYRPDVVLLDIGLPGMDGYEVAKKMRQQPNLKHVVLVAVSGYGHESDHRRSQEEGFDHHLVKPIDFGKLQQILATVKAT